MRRVRRRDELARMPSRLRACGDRSERLGVGTLRPERARAFGVGERGR